MALEIEKHLDWRFSENQMTINEFCKEVIQKFLIMFMEMRNGGFKVFYITVFKILSFVRAKQYQKITYNVIQQMELRNYWK